MTFAEEEALRDRLHAAIARATDLPDSVAKDVAFHMADWLDDLRNFASYCDGTSEPTDEEFADMLMGFLIHVPNHLNAAAKLFADCVVRDVFELGIFEEDED